MTQHLLPVQPAPDSVDRELDPLLSEPFARVWAEPEAPAAGPVRQRLLDRVSATRRAEAGMVTRRRRRTPGQPLANGVTAQTLYTAEDPAATRPGEPLRVRLLELRAGSELSALQLGHPDDLQARHREWLLLSGTVRQGGQALAPRDYLVTPAGAPTPAWQAETDALLFLRESDLPPLPDDGPQLVRDADAGWPEFAPGIRRRVLWQRAGQAALLYHADPGARVPGHSHGHDEECLMVQGELFLDDLLLQPGDYQLAPAGTGHRITETDTGVVIWAHGDLDLQFT